MLGNKTLNEQSKSAQQAAPSDSTEAKNPAAPDGTADGQRTAAELGVADTLPPTWCPRCQAEVVPRGKGLCPRCGRTLKGSFLSRRHPINVLRRDALLAKLVNDYQPDTTMLHATCEHLATIPEQLEVLRPGSTEHARLVQLAQQLAEALEATRATRAAAPDDQNTVTVVRRVIVGTRTERAAGNATEHTGPVQAPTDPAGEAPVPSSATLTPEQCCPYCQQSPSRCAEIKSTRLDAWRAMHCADPAEIKRLDDDATQEMMRQVGRGLPRWYTQ
jgi:hypothetical protein